MIRQSFTYNVNPCAIYYQHTWSVLKFCGCWIYHRGASWFCFISLKHCCPSCHGQAIRSPIATLLIGRHTVGDTLFHRKVLTIAAAIWTSLAHWCCAVKIETFVTVSTLSIWYSSTVTGYGPVWATFAAICTAISRVFTRIGRSWQTLYTTYRCIADDAASACNTWPKPDGAPQAVFTANHSPCRRMNFLDLLCFADFVSFRTM